MEAVAQFAPFAIILLLFWLLLIRPAQRRQREAMATQRSATVGSEIMLSAGIFGTVTSTQDDTLEVEIAPGTSVKVARGAVSRVISAPEEPTANEPGTSTDEQ